MWWCNNILIIIDIIRKERLVAKAFASTLFLCSSEIISQWKLCYLLLFVKCKNGFSQFVLFRCLKSRQIFLQTLTLEDGKRSIIRRWTPTCLKLNLLACFPEVLILVIVYWFNWINALGSIQLMQWKFLVSWLISIWAQLKGTIGKY